MRGGSVTCRPDEVVVGVGHVGSKALEGCLRERDRYGGREVGTHEYDHGAIERTGRICDASGKGGS